MKMSVFTILILTFLLPVKRDTFTLAADLHLVGVKGRTVVLHCSAIDPQRPLCWLYNYNMTILCWGMKDFHPSDQFRGKVKRLNKNSLELSNLSVSDTGIYSCHTFSNRWEKQENIRLIVKEVPVSKPSITQNPDSEQVNQGTSVTLTCHSENGSWPILYAWLRLDRGTGKYISLWAPNNTLSFDYARPEDSGEYRCVASNQGEGRTWSHSATFRLSVHNTISDISLMVEPQSFIFFEGQPLVLRCRVKTGSEPIIWSWFWERDGSEDQLVEGSERDLWLGSVEQSGEYSCRARQQYDGHNITLDSDAVPVLILPKPAPHPMVWVTLALSGCAVLIAVLSWRRRTHTHTLERGQTELQAIQTSSKPSRIHEASNHRQSTGQDDSYCPLSGNRNEELYDTLN
ncbi:hypothetical protein SKAU_G00420590 [Synaphobranchus kaupii]|uniref:Ig-like domain-containing protein n=1 Tax=Synaphobranchus kaupii TaxID=118154 RepID=A0A9Q1I980_SYNKA|nr:hypothetical protein SKAU_G00420590 [Synaphobranchus kaupii]